MHATAEESQDGFGSGVLCDETAQGTANRRTCQQVPSSAPGGEREITEAARHPARC